MNYVHYSLMFLIGIFKNTILWLFNTEIVNYNDTSISFGAMFLYFFIVYIVISFLLNARFSNIAQVRKEHVKNERQFENNVTVRYKKTDSYNQMRANQYFGSSYAWRNQKTISTDSNGVVN